MRRSAISARKKRHVFERARGCCEYCRSQARFATQSFVIEHIVPRSEQGSDTLDNLALACQGCNNHKYTKTEAADPITGKTIALYHPRQQRWRDHFTWDATYTHIIGVTPVGRATVQALQLNRAGLVNLRRALYAIGAHPPSELE